MKPDILVTLEGLLPTPQGVGLFLSDRAKTIAIFVDPYVALCVARFCRNERSARPLTHELILNIFAGLGARMQKVVIHDLREETFFAHIFLRQENELGRNEIVLDARPSDSVALALAQHCPIFVQNDVWDRAEDMTWALDQARQAGQDLRNSGEPPEGGASRQDP